MFITSRVDPTAAELVDAYARGQAATRDLKAIVTAGPSWDRALPWPARIQRYCGDIKRIRAARKGIETWRSQQLHHSRQVTARILFERRQPLTPTQSAELDRLSVKMIECLVKDI